MGKIIDWLVTHDTTVIGGLSILLLIIGGVLSQAGRWLLTTIFSYLKSSQDIQIREKDMDIREFITKRFDKIDEKFEKINTRLDGIDNSLDSINKRLDVIEIDVNDLKRKWSALPFASLFK
jgi:predicted nuclease with TOPRIM domain